MSANDPYTVSVRYILTTDAEETDYVQRVKIYPGYSSEEDIPKIIAVSRGREVEEIKIIAKRLT